MHTRVLVGTSLVRREENLYVLVRIVDVTKMIDVKKNRLLPTLQIRKSIRIVVAGLCRHL